MKSLKIQKVKPESLPCCVQIKSFVSSRRNNQKSVQNISKKDLKCCSNLIKIMFRNRPDLAQI